MKNTLLLLFVIISACGIAQQGNIINVAKERPSDLEYFAAPDSLGNRMASKTAVVQNALKTTTNNIKLPYPIIFIHGLNSEAETWVPTTFNFLTPQYGLVNGGRFDYCLNFDGNNTLANANFYPNASADIAVFNGSWIAGDFYYVNFNVGIDGAYMPSNLASNYVLSNQSAIVKQGRALSDAIARVLQLTGRDKVVLMGHSMGGLAAREYLQNPSNWQADGKSHVAKLATTGTPHGGSNATSFGTISSNTEGQSEAIRDLRRNYYYSGNSGVYLFGGPESLPYMDDQVCCYFYNADVNCNGTAQTNIVGLNQKSIYSNLDYSCIIGECSGCVGTTNAGDGIVPDFSANLNTYYSNITTNLFYYYASAAVEIHTDLPAQYPLNMQALDEPGYTNLAYRVGFDSLYTGFLTVPSSLDPNSPYDSDLYKFSVTSASTINASVSNLIIALGYTVCILNSSNQVVNTAVHTAGSTQNISFNTALTSGTYYLQVYGIPTASSYLTPYNFILHTVSTVGIEENQAVSNLKVYPNPSASFINIIDDMHLLENATVQIVNNIGEAVLTVPYTAKIDVAALSSGCYFLKVINGNQSVFHGKFVKE